ncbi:MAG: photosystem II complex extrinsic protein PsbU [Cyanobacteria bacterium P01_E01_bin.6]
MKRLAGVLAVLVMMVSVLGWIGVPRPAHAAGFNSLTVGSSPILAAERRNAVEEKLSNSFGTTIDLNNSNVRAFIQFPGMYPTLAGIIVRNSPYSSVDDVFKIPGLTDRQKSVLERYKDRLLVTDPSEAMVEGGDRFNNGFYD